MKKVAPKPPQKPFSIEKDALSAIRELVHALTAASMNYEVWRVYKSPRHRKKYLSAMNDYAPFFKASIHAHFLAVIIPLYRLYETPDDRFNIPSLLKTLRENDALTTAVLNRLDRAHKKIKPLWVKISMVRNNVFGHRSKKQSIEAVFTSAAITPAEIKSLIQQSQKLLNRISYALERGSYGFDTGAEKSTLDLLKCISLNKIKQKRRKTRPR